MRLITPGFQNNSVKTTRFAAVNVKPAFAAVIDKTAAK